MFNRRDWIGTALAVSAMGVSKVRAADKVAAWPSWRGPHRDGTCPGVDWPSSLSGLTKSWSVGLADSYSGPIVANGTVFTTETVAAREETLVALDQETGEQVWKTQWPGAMSVPFFAKSNGDWIRSTPATDGRHIVVGGMRDVLVCFDCKTGDEVWRVDFVKDHGAELPSFGLVCSPLIDGDSVYVQAGGAVRKLAMRDGAFVWDTMPDRGGMSGGAFSSPIIATLHGVRQLVTQTRTTLCGIDLDSGKTLWQRDIASFRGMNILTPTIWENHVFTSCYGGKAQLLQLEPGDSSWATNVVWESKAEAYMSSPLIVGQHLYMHLKNNRFCCVDLSTGKETWRTTPFGKYWSMLTDGQLILALDQVGELLLIKANPKQHELLDRRDISSEPAWAHLAVVGNQILVRRQRGLDAYRWA